MPEIEDPSSVVQTRVRFQESFAERAPSDSDAAMDLSGDEAKEERGVIRGGAQSQTFELQEDPSFWKDHNVQVVIRIRPLSTFEISLQGYNKCVRQDSCQTVTWTGHPESRFTFDLVADEHVSQEKLFKVAGVPMVDNCVAGYNSCMFAYGQTGSGKTHTMLGDIEGGTGRHSVNCGMTPRVFEYLFTRILKEKESRKDEKLQFTCRCSFLEIYNEHILDLLEPSSSNLQLREDAKKGIHVENLKEFEVSSARDVMQQLIQGAANRKVAATNMNRASSRSHSVFTCVIESKWESQGVIHHRFARLNLVDLAGSERQKASGAEGERLKEATNINKSLSTLGLVIMNLVSISNKKSMHVPYRDSKLTFLLQDSLGGNSKTIIIANISPSNCCALETLSTLKFAQRAKFIRNNAMVNEDASGDVLAMRLQIQQLKKEVNRLRGLNGGSEIPESNDMSGCIPGSPTSFKWDGGHGSFSPLTFDKRLSQRKEYEAALVAAFRRGQDKDAALKALTAGKQAAEQLATQRTEEVRSLKMILRFREEGIKRLEAVASGKILAQFHLLQEKEEILKEMEVLRNQVDRNPERTRFAMENLQLKEEVRRLQSFVEEGEREMMNEQITLLQDKLLEALDWKLMHEKDSEGLSLSWESSINEENEFLRLQAIQNEREVEALRRNLSVCLEAKEKLERRVDDLVLQLVEQRKPTGCQDEEMPQAPMESAIDNSPDDQMDLKTMVDVIAAATQREAEAHEMSIILVKENEELRIKIRDLVEDNNKLIDLYESAAREGTGKRSHVALQSASVENQPILPQNLAKMGTPDQVVMASCSEVKDVEDLEHQLRDMHEENDKLMGLYERAMQERDEFKRTLTSYENSRAVPETKEEINCPEENVEVYDGVHPMQEEGSDELQENDNCAVISVENLCLAANKLDQVQDKLVTAGKAFKAFGDIEKAIFELDDISGKFSAIDHDAQLTRQEITALKLSLSELKGRKTVAENKLLELKESLYSFSSRVQYSEEREISTRASLDAYSRSMKQKNEELRNLQLRKDEINTACSKSQQSESELRNNIERLKLKLQDAEARRKESERVLFAVDNLDQTELPTQRTLNFGKASELLKSEEERTEIRAELKQSRERLASVRKETMDSKKMSEDLDSLIESLKAGIACESASMEAVELDLQKITDEKKMLLVMRDNINAELREMLINFECDFESVVKEGEIQLCEEALKVNVKKLDKLREKQAVVRGKLNHLMQEKRCSFNASEELEEELGGAQRSLTEAKSLLLGINC